MFNIFKKVQSDDVTIISAEASIQGDLIIPKDLYIEGSITGNKIQARSIYISKTSIVQSGIITCGTIEIAGDLKGHVICTSLKVLPGGSFNGTVEYKGTIESLGVMNATLVKIEDTKKVSKPVEIVK